MTKDAADVILLEKELGGLCGGVLGRCHQVRTDRHVLYLLLAGALFADCGYVQVWHRLAVGLGRTIAAAPTSGALCGARRRTGVKPLQFLFDLLRGTAVTSAAGSVRWCGLLVCAIDGTVMSVADNAANLHVFAKHRCNNGGSGHPLMRVMVLVSCPSAIHASDADVLVRLKTAAGCPSFAAYRMAPTCR